MSKKKSKFPLFFIKNSINLKIKSLFSKTYSITLKYSPESKYKIPFLLLNSLIISI